LALTQPVVVRPSRLYKDMSAGKIGPFGETARMLTNMCAGPIHGYRRIGEIEFC
jgi:hypothetical protein